MDTNIYVDGFNLYYGSLKYTNYKWLDISKLVTALFPTTTVNKIRYFTANVKSSRHDPDAPVRQNIYLRALATIPNLTTHKGRFALREVCLPQFPLAYINDNTTRPPQNVQVLKPEEKRSDVNLATYLLKDCYTNDFDEAVIISNDSDLFLPIQVVIQDCGKKVHSVNPHKRWKLSQELASVASSAMAEINKRHLASSQFPPQMVDSTGTFNKPTSW